MKMNNMCKNSKLQEYQCQVCAKPFWNKDKFVCFDVCLAAEILYLWSMEIKATGCCCGNHGGISNGHEFISVLPDYNQKMINLGYKKIREDHYIPKTKSLTQEIKDLKLSVSNKQLDIEALLDACHTCKLVKNEQ